MTKLHKIDREKLAEALRLLEHSDVGEWDKFREETGVTPHVYRRQAAENWLAITDAGFEVSEAMCDIGDKLTSKAWDKGYEPEAGMIFKAMIAKAGE